MPKEKFKQKLMKHRICAVARVIACASFLMLTVIGVSSLVRAMSLESIENQNGIPSAWKVASLGNPDTISIPITYWDQRQESCTDPNRQFEWSQCKLYAKGIIKDVVKSQLGEDGLPVPTYNNSKDAWQAYHDVFTSNVIGNDPVKSTDNFYRWFHEAYDAEGNQISKRYDREVTFTRTNNNTYEYGSKGTFPLDDVDFSKDDEATKTGHNFHFTAHMQIPMKIAADGSEKFWFSGDDDVWVFLNGQLVLDLGGLHMDTEGSFTINSQGNVISTVNNVADKACRQRSVYKPTAVGYDTYNSQVENNCPRDTQTTVINTNFQPGDIVNLDFFYAERSTSESNTRITISNMQWPISADSDVSGSIQGKVDNTEKNLVEYITSVSNRDPMFPLTLKRMASYIYDESSATDKDGQTQTFTNSGFIPLSESTLYYSTSLTEPNWQPVAISSPLNSLDGFSLQDPITLSPSGKAGDTVYFRFVAETSEYAGNITNRTSYYTELNGVSGITFDHVTLPYTGKTTLDDGGNPGGDDDKTTYDVTVNYRIESDDDPADIPETPGSITEEHNDGDTYSIPSPEVPGYEPDYKIVEGVIAGENVEREVVYRKKREEEPTKYKVTIHYVKTDGSNAFPDHIELVEPGGSISVTSPSLEKHTHNPDVVESNNIQGDEEYTVTYTPIREEHTVTVHYVYENGSTAHEDYQGTYKEGEKFSINSPVIDGYRRDIAVVSGIMSNKDREFVVTYTMLDEPVGPSPIIPGGPTNPEEPENPENPENPEDPEAPEENDNLIPSLPVTPGEDDRLTYTGPLGEIAFVPNTGIVSDLLSPIFDQEFAEIILSQGFVLAMLLIFAGSFSTYFSLRKYLHLAVAPSTTRSVKKMPKSIANSKTAKKMQKNAKKSARKK